VTSTRGERVLGAVAVVVAFATFLFKDFVGLRERKAHFKSVGILRSLARCPQMPPDDRTRRKISISSCHPPQNSHGERTIINEFHAIH
jgi:hypothetical protein